MSENKLHVIDLHKRYGGHEVLKGVSLQARAGDVISIIGSSGSGKSTFLRCINFLEKPSEGAIIVNGQNINLVRDKDGQLKVADKNQLRLLRTRLTMVFQHFNLWSHMTVLENVMEAPIQVLGLSKHDARERALKYLAKVGIDERAQGKYPVHLSGGQQQRVSIARALAMEPDVYCSMNPLRRSILNWSAKCCASCNNWRKKAKRWWWSRMKWASLAMSLRTLFFCIRGKLKKRAIRSRCSAIRKARVYSNS